MSRRSKKQRRKQPVLTTGVNPSSVASTALRKPEDLPSEAASGQAVRQYTPQTWSGGDWGFSLLLVAAIFIGYLPVWRAGFVWDDDFHLTSNPCIIGPLGFSAIWTSSAAIYYPLVLTSFWLQHALWGLNPLPYHLVNVAMHAGCAILLWRVLLALHVRSAWLGAALWALHPVMVESVAWITELKNTQSCFFYLMAIFFFLRWRRIIAGAAAPAGAWSYYSLSLLCTALAILSKSSTVMLPVVMGLCAWWTEGRWQWRGAMWLAPFLLISLAAGGWTIWEQKFHSGALGGAWSQSWPERLLIAGDSLWFYLGKLAWPDPLIFIYPRWKIGLSQPLAWLPGIAAATAVFILWRGRNGWMRPLFFAAVYFVVSLFPVLGFFSIYFFRYSFVADHFQYLAAIGPLALAGAALATLPGLLKIRNPALLPVGCAVLLAGSAALTWRHTRAFHDAETLWRATFAGNPGCWMAHTNLGYLLLTQGRAGEAIAQCREALQINPDDEEAHDTLGTALSRDGKTVEAVAQYREALRIKPAFAQAFVNLGSALFQQGKTDAAISGYREALRIKPDYPDAENNLGLALFQQGRVDEAIAHYREALRIKPAYEEAHNDLGIALLQQGRTEEAVDHYREALRIDPNFAPASFNLGNALFQQGQIDDAIVHYREALRANPDYEDAHTNLGLALFLQGRTQEAITHYREALRIKPADANVHNNLGNALFQAGEDEEAIAQAEKALALQPANPAIQNNLARMLATAPQVSLRNGARSLELATKANQSTGGNDPLSMRILAAAYAETGRFAEAVQTANKALELAQAWSNSDLVEALRREIKLYEAGHRFEGAR